MVWQPFTEDEVINSLVKINVILNRDMIMHGKEHNASVRTVVMSIFSDVVRRRFIIDYPTNLIKKLREFVQSGLFKTEKVTSDTLFYPVHMVRIQPSRIILDGNAFTLQIREGLNAEVQRRTFAELYAMQTEVRKTAPDIGTSTEKIRSDERLISSELVEVVPLSQPNLSVYMDIKYADRNPFTTFFNIVNSFKNGEPATTAAG